MNVIKTILAGLAGFAAIGSLAFAPVVAYADNGNEGSSLAASVSINPAGHVMVRNATVTGVSGNTISATTSWGSETLSWSVLVGSSTELTGGAMLASVKNGDRINFQGKLDTTLSSLTVQAQVVRDLSLSESVSANVRHRNVEGRIEAISGNTLTIAQGSRTFTVDVSENTKLDKRGLAAVVFGDLKDGDRVRVSGTGTTTINATMVRDLTR